jgi:hypothetical protein
MQLACLTGLETDALLQCASKNVVPSPLLDRVLPPENAKAALLGASPVVIAENMKDGQEPEDNIRRFFGGGRAVGAGLATPGTFLPVRRSAVAPPSPAVARKIIGWPGSREVARMSKTIATAIIVVATVSSSASAQMRSVSDFGPYWDVLEGIGISGHPTLVLQTHDKDKNTVFGVKLSGDRPAAITLAFGNMAWNIAENRIPAQVQIGDVKSSYEAQRITGQVVEIVTSDMPGHHNVAKSITITLQGYALTTIALDRPGVDEAFAAFRFRGPQIAMAMMATVLNDIGKKMGELRDELGK